MWDAGSGPHPRLQCDELLMAGTRYDPLVNYRPVARPAGRID